MKYNLFKGPLSQLLLTLRTFVTYLTYFTYRFLLKCLTCLITCSKTAFCRREHEGCLRFYLFSMDIYFLCILVISAYIFVDLLGLYRGYVSATFCFLQRSPINNGQWFSMAKTYKQTTYRFGYVSTNFRQVI